MQHQLLLHTYGKIKSSAETEPAAFTCLNFPVLLMALALEIPIYNIRAAGCQHTLNKAPPSRSLMSSGLASATGMSCRSSCGLCPRNALIAQYTHWPDG
eukprot:scaffold431688_cov19-Prasinocladus_malaysianus.AAC.1